MKKSFRVTVEMPFNSTIKEVQDYIRKAVKYGKAFKPLDLYEETVTVTPISKGKHFQPLKLKSMKGNY